MVSLDNLAVRSASPRNRPIRISQRDRNTSAASTKNNSNAVAKGAHLRRTVNSPGEHQRKAANTRPVEMSPKKPVQKAAKTRFADKLATDRTPTFDWPVHGKILARFGPQPNGQKNEGIKIAVPESTPIRSAEDGVVIYAGSGLKGFGNLVLVRHTNDYVTVYAHAKELKAKRGDQIKRADIIASSGQTGNVSTPQVYFEVRKGSAPVDPLRLLQNRTEPKRSFTTPSSSRSRAPATVSVSTPISSLSTSDPRPFNRPGGNITGVAALTIELDPKRLELLHELTPSGGPIGVLLNPSWPDIQIQVEGIETAARSVGRQLVPAYASTGPQLDAAFAILAEQSVAGLLVAADPFFSGQRLPIIVLATRHGWPAIYQWREFADAGGLASYGPSLFDSYRQVGLFAARILKGEKPADLPVQQPTKFEFVINLRTARALGLTVPLALLSRADEVIE